jgi:KaiC/GvpD/RAD55 family RecA-like ATPase
MTSQYAITTSEAFGWGVEHIADGIIRFRRSVRGGTLRRYILVEKMRQTPHSLQMYEIDILQGRGLVIKGPVGMRREDIVLPKHVMNKIRKSTEMRDVEAP